MIRNLLLAIAALTLAGVVLWQGQADPPAPGGCAGVRRAHERVLELEAGRQVPTADGYATAAQDVRRAAVAAPDGVSGDVHAVADAYGQLAILFRGFDPEDPATYTLIEERTPAIEREEARVDDATARIEAWLRDSCGT